MPARLTRLAARLAVLAVLAVAATGCSSFQGQIGRTDDSFIVEHGRVCTAVKWGDAASLDCDFAPEDTTGQ